MRQLAGPRSGWYQTAGCFDHPEFIRRALRKAVAKVKKHLDNVLTADDSLLLIANSTLDRLEGEIENLQRDSYSELEIIAHLLSLIADLLGLDGFEGKSNRQVIYYQTLEQIQNDDAKRHRGDYAFGMPEYPKFLEKRAEIIAMLFRQDLPIAQIAIIMKLSDRSVRDALVKAGLITRRSGSKKQS